MKIKVNLSLIFLLKNRVHLSLPLSISPSFIHCLSPNGLYSDTEVCIKGINMKVLKLKE